MKQNKHIPIEAVKAIKKLYPDSESVFTKAAEVMILKTDRCICDASVAMYYNRIPGTYQYKCRRCRKVISPLAVTPLGRDRKNLTDAIELASRFYFIRKELSPVEISRLYKCKYETAQRKSSRVIKWMKLALAHSGNAPPDNHRKVIKTFASKYDTVLEALNGLFNSLPRLLDGIEHSKNNNKTKNHENFK